MLTVLLSTLAFGRDCPWANEKSISVTADMKTIYVNGEAFPVMGKVARTNFTGVLAACHQGEAAIQFEKWRSWRRSTNATWTVWALLLPFSVVATPIALIPPAVAGGAKNNTVRTIQVSWDPDDVKGD